MNNVRELRIKKGLQQKELAIEIGVSNATVSDWEHGRKNPSGERLRKLAKFFGVSEADVLGMTSTQDAMRMGKPETWQIVNQLLEKLESQPQTPEARFVSIAMDKMPPEDREKAVNVLKAMYAEYFSEDKIG